MPKKLEKQKIDQTEGMRIRTVSERQQGRGQSPMHSGKPRQGWPDSGLSAAEALFIALGDGQAAFFMKTHFSPPEQRAHVFSKRWIIRENSCCFWHVAVIEQGRVPTGTRPLINVAHIIVDGFSGRIQKKWLLGNIFEDEYRQFLKELFARHGGCRVRIL